MVLLGGGGGQEVVAGLSGDNRTFASRGEFGIFWCFAWHEMYLQIPSWEQIKGFIFNGASGHCAVTSMFVISGVMTEGPSIALGPVRGQGVLLEMFPQLPPLRRHCVGGGRQLITEHFQSVYISGFSGFRLQMITTNDGWRLTMKNVSGLSLCRRRWNIHDLSVGTGRITVHCGTGLYNGEFETAIAEGCFEIPIKSGSANIKKRPKDFDLVYKHLRSQANGAWGVTEPGWSRDHRTPSEIPCECSDRSQMICWRGRTQNCSYVYKEPNILIKISLKAWVE